MDAVLHFLVEQEEKNTTSAGTDGIVPRRSD
jgi:hypothetical protein